VPPAPPPPHSVPLCSLVAILFGRKKRARSHSALPYATGLKHTRPIVNQPSPLPSCPATCAFSLISLPLLSLYPPPPPSLSLSLVVVLALALTPRALSRSRPSVSLAAIHKSARADTRAPNAPTAAPTCSPSFFYARMHSPHGHAPHRALTSCSRA